MQSSCLRSVLKFYLEKQEQDWSSRLHLYLCILTQVPHSQCSLRLSPKFCQNFKSKFNTPKCNFWLLLLFNICHCNSGLALRSWKLLFYTIKFCVFHIWNYAKLTSQTKVSFVNVEPVQERPITFLPSFDSRAIEMSKQEQSHKSSIYIGFFFK
jgi:hypothetical protein